MIPKTATLIQTGPINGLWSESAGLYQLSSPMQYDGIEIDHVVVSYVGKDVYGPANTVMVPATGRGYMMLSPGAGLLLDHNAEGFTHAEALAMIGYELVPATLEV